MRLNPDVPTKLEEIISKALEKDRNLRYQHSADMRADLQRLKRDTDSGRSGKMIEAMQSSAAPDAHRGAPPPSGSISPHGPHLSGSSSVIEVAKQHKFGLSAAIVIVLAVIVAAGYGVYSLLRGHRALPFENFAITQVTNDGNAQLAAISPDGKYLLRVVADAGKQSLWLRHVPTSSDTQVVAPTDSFIRSLMFSPDGNYIYFRKAADKSNTTFDLYRAPVFGGTPTAVVRDVDTNITFSPDGKRMAYARFNDPEIGKFQLLVSSADGTAEKTIQNGPQTDYVSWSPDGRYIAGIVFQTGGSFCAIQLLDVLSGESHTLVEFMDRGISEAVWTPDARGLIVTYRAKGSARVQIGFVSSPKGEFHPITKDTSSYQEITFASDGKTLAVVQQKITKTFHIVRATGFSDNVPNPALSQIKNPLGFGWSGSGEVYISDTNSLMRISSDEAIKRRCSVTPMLRSFQVENVEAGNILS